MNIRNFLLLSLLIATAGVIRAQGYYDDDIYFNSSKDKDKNIELAKKQAETAKKRNTNGYILYPVADYPAADTYSPEGSSTISVDDYNRRGIFGRDSVSTKNGDTTQDFSYTRRIEKFYNPAIVVGSNDAELAELYYAQPANVNIYINTPSYGYWGYPYAWNGWYDSWYPYNYWASSWYWGSSWAWGPTWGWGPSWSWGPAWGWGPAYGPAWSWAPSRPYYNPRHPGALASSRPSYGSGITTRPANNRYTNGYRPAYNSNRHNGSVTDRPASNNNYNTNRDNNSYTRPGRTTNNNNTYRSNNTGSYRSSGSMGGSTRSSGGGGRGRH